MSMFKRKDHSVPGLNTASLPDLIFTVLFFFMIVTHMKENQMKVKYQVPQGTKLERLAKKSTVSHIYIGKPYKGGGDNAVQVNDKIVDAADVEDFIAAERKRMAPDDAKNMTVSIKADKKADMGVVTDVKQSLRRANALKILYSGKKSTKK
ncbi:MAG: biopolymer transporter ExbD [Prevotella sp.]|nr:biopolymer transporter ExbD [Prevotella sp.]MDD7028281.1 biopolymer transporter ExbD [Prevotellaceae bacterium]MCI7016863.1 biopolymer transporter ExbD [Prevotella sp.]MCI7579339.1 biopolymer transporter ExbD [Prevotella sp.]MDY3251730.1 biopolymer transporter ExbD [Prevotella sp.]